MHPESIDDDDNTYQLVAHSPVSFPVSQTLHLECRKETDIMHKIYDCNTQIGYLLLDYTSTNRNNSPDNHLEWSKDNNIAEHVANIISHTLSIRSGIRPQITQEPSVRTEFTYTYA